MEKRVNIISSVGIILMLSLDIYATNALGIHFGWKVGVDIIAKRLGKDAILRKIINAATDFIVVVITIGHHAKYHQLHIVAVMPAMRAFWITTQAGNPVKHALTLWWTIHV